MNFPPELLKVVEDAYQQYGFDPKNPPSNLILATWATKLVHKWFDNPKPQMNLPLTGLCIAFNMMTCGKLDDSDQAYLKQLLCVVYNMGYGMAQYKMKTPFDRKPQPQELN